MQAQFLPGEKGQLFSLYFPARGASRGAVLCLPPFCEEMNRSRGVMAEQARAFAAAGYSCLLFDHFGTGDSSGSLEQADWQTWHNDALVASQWLTEQSGHKPALWGIRLGALLAADLVAARPQDFHHLLLWHPVIDGKTYLTQTLRLRVASLIEREQAAEKTNDMRDAFARGESVEVVGYSIPADIAQAIDQRAFKNAALDQLRVDWIEPIAEGQETLPGAVTRTAELLRDDKACTVTLQPIEVPPLWVLAERVEASDLVKASTQLLAEGQAHD